MKQVLLLFSGRIDRWARAGPHGIAKKLIAYLNERKAGAYGIELKITYLSSIPLYILSLVASHILFKRIHAIPVRLLDFFSQLLLKLKIYCMRSFISKKKELVNKASIIQIHDPVTYICLLSTLPDILEKKPVIYAHHAPGALHIYLVRQYSKLKGCTYVQKIKKLEILTFKHVKRLIVPSKYTLRLLQLDLPEVDFSRKKINVIYNGIEPLGGSKGKIRQALNIPRDAFIISTVAKLIKDKGVDLIIRAAHILTTKYSIKNFHVVIRGYGPELPRLKKLVQELGLSGKIHFLPYIKNIGDLYVDSDVFVMAQRRAAFDLTVLEALSAGVPVVVSDIEGNVEAVGSAGLRFKSEDVHALAKTIYRLYVDHELRDTLSKKALKIFRERYTLEVMANNYIRVYRELIREPCTPGRAEP